MIYASAWKYTAEDDGAVYRMQVNFADGKTRDIVEKTLEDWNPSGEGWNNEGVILFFTKKFRDTENWEEWVKTFKVFNLKVLDREGKAKKEIKVETPVVKAEVSKRVCSKCKQSGHNARSCVAAFRKKETVVKIEPVQPIKPVSMESKGGRKCSKCGGPNHNARTCKNKGVS